MRTTLTKAEARQVLREDPVVRWFLDTLILKFESEKNLRGADSAERLWQLKGQAHILQYLRDPEVLVDEMGLPEEEPGR